MSQVTKHQMSARRIQVIRVVRKAPDSFLVKIMSNPRNWDLDIVVASVKELQSRGAIQ